MTLADKLIEMLPKDLPRALHEWYLEAITSGIVGEYYNPNALKSYDDLTAEQRAIDIYIADKIKQALSRVEIDEERLAVFLHDKYLEATAWLKRDGDISGDNYNPNACKSFENLTEEQKFIDRYIANAIAQAKPFKMKEEK